MELGFAPLHLLDRQFWHRDNDVGLERYPVNWGVSEENNKSQPQVPPSATADE